MLSVALEEEWDRIVGRLCTERIDALLQPMAQPVDIYDLRSIPVAAKLVGIHPKSLYRLVERGRVQAFGRRGFLKVSIRELLKPVERKPSGKKLKSAVSGGMAPGAEKLA